jgi:hypothetical protein
MRSVALLPALLCCFACLLIAGCPPQTPGRDVNEPPADSNAPADNNEPGDDDLTGDDDDAGDPLADLGTADIDAGAVDEDHAPPAFLPTSIDLDIDELPEDESSTAKSLTASNPSLNSYERVVRSAATIVHRFHRICRRALALGAAIRADMDDPNAAQVAGSYFVGLEEVAYKVDFTAFDFDGDGTPDGSGNAVTYPVAFRMWTDRGAGFVPFMCALITQPPTTDHVGAGSFYVVPRAGDPRAPEGIALHVDYDRTAEHKWNQMYLSGSLHPAYVLDIGLARVDVRTTDLGTEKTVRAAYEYTANPFQFTSFQSAVHYALGQSGLLLSGVASQAAGGQITFENICVDLSSRIPLGSDSCSEFDTQDMNLLDLPLGGEVEFPADFPAAPTF